MKKKSLFTLAIIFLLCACHHSLTSDDFSAAEQGFITPPDSVRIGCYWYWLNDNLSKDGIIKDLQAMKKAGINRAFIGSNIVSGSNFGKVKVFTDEWYDMLHTALKTATELDIEIGLFNCPGWSQSGGPWVKPEQAMRYLASSELQVKGPAEITRKLAQPTDFFQDVKVIAFPVAPDYNVNLADASNARIVSSNNNESYINIVLPQAATARSLAVYPAGRLKATVELQIKEKEGFRTIKQFEVDRTNFSVQVGFEPYSPVAVSFPEIEAKEYRVVFHNQLKEDLQIKQIRLSGTPIIERYAEKTLAKVSQGTLPEWNHYLWDVQPELKNFTVATPQQIRDISEYMLPDGTLTWDVPEGEWIIMRTGMALTGVQNGPASPEGTGLEVDKMNKAHIAAHFDGFLGEIIKRIPAEDRRAWRIVVEDSYEMGSQNFTDGFFEEFKRRYDYNAVPFLPVFKGHIIGSPDISDRFLWDVRRMVADKVSYDYVGGLREISHQHGFTTWLENYGHWGFPGEFLQYGGQSDEVAGEFWSGGGTNRYENRVAASCAHIYGKNNVWAESFTSGGPAFVRYPGEMKQLGDWSFTEGINSTLLHVYIEQAYEDRNPGIDAWFGNEFNRKNTWFNQMDLFTLYLKRCNFMLQQGLSVADVAYFIGEDAPKMTGIRNPELPKGYDYDYINAEVIIRDLSVKDGRLVLPHGTSYRLLVLPPLESMRPEVLLKIEQLVADGAVVLGPPPSRSPSMKGYPRADLQIQELAKKMWGDLSVKQRTYGKGQIWTDISMEEVLTSLNVIPDLLPDNDAVLYTHRRFGKSEIYFVSNQSEQPVTIRAGFRVKGLQPELWDALTGVIRPLPAFEQAGETTFVPLQLDANGSVFIVFRKKGNPVAKELAANFPKPDMIATVDTPWEVRFESDSIRRGPAEPVIFNELKDWAQSEDERIRYFSGTAVYTTKVTLDAIPKGKQLYLDLGEVSVMAKIKINGEYAGGVWTFPYKVAVNGLFRQGENTVEIEVVNTWKNRLIGDQQLPEKDRKVQSDYSQWKADSPLQKSGLIGPVKITG
ncbi:MAG: glycoside hydrolase family 2 [Mediterranea sp.]|nr:glycoside hydrolase family 2 [Mediterranea sp.]